MKKTIKNRVYNTETATKIATVYSNGLADINSLYNDDYYQKKNGEMFLVYNNQIYITDVKESFELDKIKYWHISTSNIREAGYNPTQPFILMY